MLGSAERKRLGKSAVKLLVGAYALGPAYTVKTYSKPLLYDASKGNDVWFFQRAGFLQQKTSALGKTDVDLFIARTDTRQTRSQSDSTQLKAGNFLRITTYMITIPQRPRRTDSLRWQYRAVRIASRSKKNLKIGFYARWHIYAIAHICHRSSVCLSVCLSVTRRSNHVDTVHECDRRTDGRTELRRPCNAERRTVKTRPSMTE